ncbi:unnamed protein product [marine sediment metagenome]|uniref:Uncharacterized protein n=1 Tax=marine sediment metagenome TaxID=412755 RepID=X1LS82_9ZZZZ
MRTAKSIADDFLKRKALSDAKGLKVVEAEKAEAEKVEAEKTDELLREVLGQKLKEVEAEGKVEAEKADPELETFTTKPMRSSRPVRVGSLACPFCDESRKRNGLQRHIDQAHGVPDVTVQDLEDVAGGVKTLEDLVYEKFDEDAEIDLRGLSDRCSQEEFGSWADVDRKVEDDPGDVDLKVEDDPGDVDLKVEGNPGLKAEGNPGRKVERRRFNWIPFFSPFNRRSYRK